MQSDKIEVIPGKSYRIVIGRTREDMSSFTFDKDISMKAIEHELAVAYRLKQKYGVRFLPKQVIRRELAKGFNPFKD